MTDQKALDWLRQLIEQKHARAREEQRPQRAKDVAAAEEADRERIYDNKADGFWEATVTEMQEQLRIFNAGMADLPDQQVSVEFVEGVFQASAKLPPERRLVCTFEHAGHSITPVFTFKRPCEGTIYHYLQTWLVTVSAAGELVATLLPKRDIEEGAQRVGFDVAPIEEERQSTPVDVASAIGKHFLERL